MKRSKTSHIGSASKSSGISQDRDLLFPGTVDQIDDDGPYRCFEVLYGTISTRKHKRWQGDGLLYCHKRYVILQTEDGEELGRANGFPLKQLSELARGSRLKVNSYEVEVQAERDSQQPTTSEFKKILKPFPESVDNVDACGKSVTKERGIIDRNFVSPIYGGDDPSDFVLDESRDENGCVRRITVDIRIAHNLRPHQKDGISFMYRYLKNSGGGVILADEMGLGKSVQTISLITALMKKRLNCEPVIRKCVIVVPTSLINNWYAEFMKWSPYSRALLFLVTKSADVEKLLSYPNLSVIVIISYEMIARTAAKLSDMSIDLLVCDEAHRLKNLNGRLREQIQTLRIQRRLLLTGTPMQNDLEEFYSLVNFARPDLFGAFVEFKYLHEMEFTRFNELLAEVMLRRTAEVNREWLPPRNDYIIWCSPSPLQCMLYTRLKKFLSRDHLTLIDLLRKLCNHPYILYQSVKSKLITCKVEEADFYNAILQLFPQPYDLSTFLVEDSGKLNLFLDLLTSFDVQNEKIVVVSNFTKTLDLLEQICRTIDMNILRLDGSTEASKRMQIVDEFNSRGDRNCAFLLSAKAGGLGLNLIGASQMILFDSDWNPAVDAQAMARIWRQGQKRPCHIYRLVTGGTVDEKILQRQIKKSNLNTVVEMIPVESLTHFSDEELQDIFTLREDTECDTHNLLDCDCGGCGFLPEERETDQETAVDEAPDVTVDGEKTEGTTASDKEILQTCEASAVLEDLNKSAASPVIHDDDSPICPGNNEVLEDEAETGIQGNDFALSTSASMGTLMRWRHYSPQHEDQFRRMIAQAGLEYSTLQNVSFVMKLVSNY